MAQNQEIISLETCLDQIPAPGGKAAWIGLPETAAAHAVARFYRRHRLPMVAVFADAKRADTFAEDLAFFLDGDGSALVRFPAYNLSPMSFVSYHNETAADRIGGLYRVVEGASAPLVITTLEAVAHRIIPKQRLTGFAELVVAGEELDRDQLLDRLLSGGYIRTAIVEEHGDFSVRGGIVDLYCPLYDDPVRIEFFGDFVESIRLFSPATQRTNDMLKEVVILPAREVVLEKSELTRITARIRKEGADNQVRVSEIRRVVEQIKAEGTMPGVESLMPLVYEQTESLFDYLDKEAVILWDTPAHMADAVSALDQKLAEFLENAGRSGKYFVNPFKLHIPVDLLKQHAAEYREVTLKPLQVVGTGDGERETVFRFSVGPPPDLQPVYSGDPVKEHMLAPLADFLSQQRQAGHAIILACRSKARRDRLTSLLAAYDIRVTPIASAAMDAPQIRRSGGRVAACLGVLSGGFAWDDERFTVISDAEIFGARKSAAKRGRRTVASQFLTLEDLKQGDLVVHVEHGIGEYQGLEKLKINGHTNDFLLVTYRDDDKLYLPVERMDVVQKYIGVEGVLPVLDKMGGKAWDRVKERVKRSAERIAGELLQLYASRKVESGFTFDVADRYFQDFEAAFPYEETADQIRAVEDVLEDMGRAAPMDRLVCGDVGYGKTEVALRAAFVAVNNNRQVAVLVPTTVLCEQHYETFMERFDRYPVKIASLSRFRNPAEQRDILKQMASGQIDIVIGTHRLLQKDVVFKDLGLLILDEEQRFGVTHKEKIKRLRKTVDVLTLTATPIPRTLQMSLMGIRDVSVIATPPEHRRPIVTYISEFDEAVIAEAVGRELKRSGQIFFVHNHIHSIDAMARRLKEIVPDVRLGVAHGRMHEKDLESVMMIFAAKEIDMLVCTTIIESGLDIPSANTIIVNRADRFGLAQMYQLRGRVGRSTEQAYAYLIIPGETLLSRDAQKRLKVLMEHSDLGSGFQIAMNDLRIRGAGTILGASQSGHIAAVGYDMFLKLMGDAISELKGEPVVAPLEPEINLAMSALIPEDYVPDIDQRLALYRRLARMPEVQDIAEIKQELVDRFGSLPKETSNLLYKIALKVLAVKAGVKRLDLSGGMLSLQFSAEHQRHPFKIVDMIATDPARYSLTPDGRFSARLHRGGHLRQTKNILKEIMGHVNC